MHVLAALLRTGKISLLFSLIVGVLGGATRADAQVVADQVGGDRAVDAKAQRHFGLGLIVGHPTGLSLKGYLTPSTAIDGAIGFGATTRDIHLHADYLWHFDVQHWNASSLQLYLGLGPELEVHSRPGPAPADGRTRFLLGARAPFGFSLLFDAPFDVFAELAAGLWFVQDPRVHVDAALGARFWF